MNKRVETAIMATTPLMIAYIAELAVTPTSLAMVGGASLFIILVRAAL